MIIEKSAADRRLAQYKHYKNDRLVCWTDLTPKS